MGDGTLGGRIALSPRLKMLADMVTPGNRLADVGCDHAFLSIYLVQAGICPGAIAMDVRGGPLAGARRHVEESGLRDYICLRLSDGLEAYRAGEAQTLVCAGMGGRLMERILREGMDKVDGLGEVILQPQSEIPHVRAFLREAGLAVTKEDAVCEEGKFYFAMKAVPQAGEYGEAARGGWGRQEGAAQDGLPGRELCDSFGGLLLADRHPVLAMYLAQREEYLGRLAASLEEVGSEKAVGRLAQVQKELEQVRAALSYLRRDP